MAKFSFNGVDEISADFEQLATLSDDEKLSVLRPAGKLLKGKFVEKIKSKFTQRTGDLADSITIEERTGDTGAYLHITPKGKHRGSGTGKRKRKNGRSNGKYSGTNAEVGFILEYGSPRIPASHWMEETNEEQADNVATAQQQAWDDLLTKKGL